MEELITHITVSIAASILNVYDGIRSVSITRFHKSINDIGAWTPTNIEYIKFVESTTRRKFVSESIQDLFVMISKNLGRIPSAKADVDAIVFDTLLNYLRISWFTKEKLTIGEAIGSIRSCLISSVTEYVLETVVPDTRSPSPPPNPTPVVVPAPAVPSVVASNDVVSQKPNSGAVPSVASSVGSDSGSDSESEVPAPPPPSKVNMRRSQNKDKDGDRFAIELEGEMDLKSRMDRIRQHRKVRGVSKRT